MKTSRCINQSVNRKQKEPIYSMDSFSYASVNLPHFQGQYREGLNLFRRRIQHRIKRLYRAEAIRIHRAAVQRQSDPLRRGF